jgi:KTSC domain
VTYDKLADQDMGPLTSGAADRALASGEPGEISMALLRLALHGPDWARAERLAREHTVHPAVWVRRNAATALGHVARVHGALDLELSLPALVRLLDDEEVHDWADAALDDVEMYLGVKRTAVLANVLAGVGYDEKTQTLEVEFRNGGVYQYNRIPAEEYAHLREAESIGRYLNTRIRPFYSCRKVREPRVAALLPVRADRITA